MRIGIMLGATPDPDASMDKFVRIAQDVEALGFDSLWMAHIRSHDAIMAMALAGRETKRIEVGTAVTPLQPRHPAALGQQALTASAMAGGRFSLGIGLSHKIVIEDALGLSYAQPAKTTREYLEVLTPILRGETAKFNGDLYNVHVEVKVADAVLPVPVLTAALGPMMLQVAGTLSDGTILWMTGPRTIAEHVVPTIGTAAQAAGRPPPRVVAGFPVILTHDETAARQFVGEQLAIYGKLPSYRAMLDREGVAGPADLALVGDETKLRHAMQQIADAGATEFTAVVMETGDGSARRTLGFLQSCLKK